MRMTRHGLVALLLLAAVHVAPAYAAESYDNCTGFIETLPATISTQGTWCLKHDVSTAITSGNAITIAANNVTLDCNDFKVGGLAAGDSSAANGVYAASRLNATVRHCGVRGFSQGIWLDGAGHLVEDNRLDNNLYIGIYIQGDNNRVQRNRVYDTGGAPGSEQSMGIFVSADVIDNTVSGVFATASVTYTSGIAVSGTGSEARGNNVRGVVESGAGESVGVNVYGASITVDRNRISAEGAMGSKGVYGATNTFCTGNTVVNFATAYDGCAASSGNLSLP
jgi:hypothetical protein